MKTIHLRSHVGADGVLALNIPTELTDTDLDVVIVVAPATSNGAPAHTADWAEFINSTAGSIPDRSFIRHPQGIFEQREPLR